MEQQKIIAIAGLNGSGKTLYVEKMRRAMASDRVRYMAFCDTYGMATDRAYYLQLRWNQHDIDEETPVTGNVLEQVFAQTGDDTLERRQLQKDLYNLFDFMPLLDKYVITLSSGELRKFQLIKTLLSKPSVLILDNPFIGLDTQARRQLDRLLQSLPQKLGLTIFLVVSRKEDMPDYVNQVIWTTPEQAFLASPGHMSDQLRQSILDLTGQQDKMNAEEVVRFNKVTIRYGTKTILHELDWTIRRGECWALLGANGSGKSTLLSLICADNPQAYACDIRLFGQQRGTGESIWDIKRRIGYVSPEMHRSYRHNISALQVVASGLKDTVGIYTRTTPSERDACRWWMRVFGIDGLEQRPFLTLSSGEQRMVLLSRAFVKDPQLLILDEPFHGLDNHRRQLANDIIETYTKRQGKTIVMVTHYEDELPSCFTMRKYLSKHI